MSRSRVKDSPAANSNPSAAATAAPPKKIDTPPALRTTHEIGAFTDPWTGLLSNVAAVVTVIRCEIIGTRPLYGGPGAANLSGGPCPVARKAPRRTRQRGTCDPGRRP